MKDSFWLNEGRFWNQYVSKPFPETPHTKKLVLLDLFLLLKILVLIKDLIPLKTLTYKKH